MKYLSSSRIVAYSAVNVELLLKTTAKLRDDTRIYKPNSTHHAYATPSLYRTPEYTALFHDFFNYELVCVNPRTSYSEHNGGLQSTRVATRTQRTPIITMVAFYASAQTEPFSMLSRDAISDAKYNLRTRLQFRHHGLLLSDRSTRPLLGFNSIEWRRL